MTKRKVAPLPPSVGDPGPRSTTLAAVDVVDTAEGLADGGAGNAGSAAGASKSNGQDAGRPMGLPLAAHRARVRDGEQPVVSPAGNAYPPLPREVDRSIPDINCAWVWFLDVDDDNSGFIDEDELGHLARKLGLRWNRKILRKVFQEIAVQADGSRKPVISFQAFALWWARYQIARRRDVGRRLKLLFEQADTKKRKVLDRAKFIELIGMANKDNSIQFGLVWPDGDPDSPSQRLAQPTSFGQTAQLVCGRKHPVDGDRSLPLVDPEEAWVECRKVPLQDNDAQALGVLRSTTSSPGPQRDDISDTALGVNFAGFEVYWKDKMGIAEPDIPVLPEFMVLRIADKVAAARAAAAQLAATKPTPEGCGQGTGETRTDKNLAHSQRWTALSAKLKALTQMKSTWGPLHTIYEARDESLFDEQPLARWIRDPDSSFSSVWDIISIFMLLYVSAAVPLRVCFGVDVELWSTTFFVEVIVDSFFIADVGLNFRTAYYDENRLRESRPAYIAKNYLRGWFPIDLVSCLPFGYIQYLKSDDDETSGQQLKSIKAVRLMKITKMMRLARLKRIIMRHRDDGAGLGNFQLWQSVGFTLFAIAFLCHMLACFYYMAGESDQTLGNGVVVIGWVKSQQDWLNTASSSSVANGTQVDPVISLSTRYVASLYYVLNALENGETAQERLFGVLAEFIRDVILGLVASLITTISMQSGQTDSELESKLHNLRNWMADQKLPTLFRKTVMQYFRRHWTTNSINLPELLADCPPGLASNMAVLLYARFIATVPLFKGLAPEVIAALCLQCKPMVCTKGQMIIQEGEPGKEMYMIIAGEVEVTKMQGNERRRLGFLAEGAFFGESPVLGWIGEPGVELRVRTVRAVTDVELAYLTRDDVHSLKNQYSELKARLLRFERCGTIVDRKTLRRIDLTEQELQDISTTFKNRLRESTNARNRHNLEEHAYVPPIFLSQTARDVMAASTRFKKVGERQRAQQQLEREKEEERMAHLKQEVERNGGMAAVMLRVEDTAKSVQDLESSLQSQMRSHARQREETQEQLLSIQRIMEDQSAHIEAMSAQIAGSAGVGGRAQEGYRLP